MNSKHDYDIFKQEIEAIVKDTFVKTPTEEEFKKDRYFFLQGLWSGTEKAIYFYDKQKIEAHRSKLLSICKRLQKFHQASNDHAGTISSFETLPPEDIFSSQPVEESIYNLELSNKFTHLLCALNIAKVSVVSQGEERAFLIVLDKKYRSYFEKDGQEPYDD